MIDTFVNQRNLLIGCLVQAIRDSMSTNKEPLAQEEKATAITWLQGETCKIYCDLVDFQYDLIVDWVAKGCLRPQGWSRNSQGKSCAGPGDLPACVAEFSDEGTRPRPPEKRVPSERAYFGNYYLTVREAKRIAGKAKVDSAKPTIVKLDIQNYQEMAQNV